MGKSSFLVAVPVYCTEKDKAKAAALDRFLSAYEETAAQFADWPEGHFLIVDNDVGHPKVLRRLEEMAGRHRNISVKRFSPQRYWSGARNYAVRRVLNEEIDLLVFLDDDMVPPAGWLGTILDVHASYPEIEIGTCLDSKNTSDIIGRVPYKDLQLVLYREFIGGLNVMTRRVLETIGGFREGEHFRYGYCDTEFGVRAVKAGFFNYAFSQFANPYGITYELISVGEVKDAWARKYLGYYRAVQAAILNGVLPTYVDPATGYPAWRVEATDD